MLKAPCAVIWDALLGVTETLHYADGSVKRQWLVNAMEISCVSKFPSTVRVSTFVCQNSNPNTKPEL